MARLALQLAERLQSSIQTLLSRSLIGTTNARKVTMFRQKAYVNRAIFSAALELYGDRPEAARIGLAAALGT